MVRGALSQRRQLVRESWSSVRKVDTQRFSHRADCVLRASSNGTARANAGSVWSDEEARFYADALTTSDYAEKVGSALRELIGAPSSLLDVGAGSGVIGRALMGASGRWTAVEPNAYLASLLERGPGCRPYHVIRDLWQNLDRHGRLVHDVVLAANMGGPMDDAAAFVDAMRPRAWTSFCWTVPAQHGPRRYCLSGFLPSELHGEDETPGHKIVLDRLGARLAPDSMTFVEWTFRALFPDAEVAEEHFARQFSLRHPRRRKELRAWVDGRLERVGSRWAAAVPKVTAVLLWRR